MSKRKWPENEEQSPESEEQSSESDSESEIEMCSYEQQRLKSIEERDKMLRNLGIGRAANELKLLTPKAAKAQYKKKSTPRIKQDKYPHLVVPKREPSRRLRNLTPDGNFQIKEEPMEFEHNEDIDERLLESLPMAMEDEESKNFMKILKDIKKEVVFDSSINLKECDIDKFQDAMMCFTMNQEPQKVVPKRIQSILVHPTVTKKLIIVGTCSGHLGLWDMEAASVFQFMPHKGPTNCITVSTKDQTKLYTTSHDGTFVCADLESSMFSNVYATDYNTSVTHLTWHDQIDSETFLLTHGNGDVGVLDLRDSTNNTTWMPCFERSARTVHHHPTKNNYFLVSTGAGACCNIYDIRQCNAKKANPVIEMPHPKGLTSAFFSPSGDQVLTTCNDDRIRIYSVSDLTKATLKKSICHNNHTGRWLSVFKANWYPSRNDAFLIGSLLRPRRVTEDGIESLLQIIASKSSVFSHLVMTSHCLKFLIQIYSSTGKLISELKSSNMETVTPVLSVHPVLPIIAGGNSSGRIHAFTAPELKT